MNPKTIDTPIDAPLEPFGPPLLLPEDPREWSKLPAWLVEGLLEQEIYQNGNPDDDMESAP